MNLARGSREPQLRLRLFSFAACGPVIMGVVLAVSACGGAPRAEYKGAYYTTTDNNAGSSATAAGGDAGAPSGGGDTGGGTLGLARASTVGAPSHARDVAAALDRSRAAWVSCRPDGLADVMRLRLTIDANGAVVATRVLETTLGDSEARCAVDAVKALRLPPPRRAPNAVEVTLRFDAGLAALRERTVAPASPIATTAPHYPAQIQATLRGAGGAFRRCAEAYLRCCPNLSARLELSFTIERDGSVGRTTADADSTIVGDEARCILDALRAVSFPPPPEGRAVVRYALRYE